MVPTNDKSPNISLHIMEIGETSKALRFSSTSQKSQIGTYAVHWRAVMHVYVVLQRWQENMEEIWRSALAACASDLKSCRHFSVAQEQKFKVARNPAHITHFYSRQILFSPFDYAKQCTLRQICRNVLSRKQKFLKYCCAGI